MHQEELICPYCKKGRINALCYTLEGLILNCNWCENSFTENQLKQNKEEK